MAHSPATRWLTLLILAVATSSAAGRLTAATIAGTIAGPGSAGTEGTTESVVNRSNGERPATLTAAGGRCAVDDLTVGAHT